MSTPAALDPNGLVETKKAQLRAITERIQLHEADFDQRRGLLLDLLEMGVTKVELATICEVTPMAINYAIDDKRKKPSTPT